METTPKARPTASLVADEAIPVVGCPSDRVLRMLWGQWKTHVVYVLGTHGPQRFGSLRRIIAGISPKVLTQRLRELEGDGLVWREQAQTIPPEVTYGLTDRGLQIHEILRKFDAIDAT
ncbi:helix-turn-helix domain-containing protein [Fulvimarina sp. MAC8]|uniref:winged helix-turn-helix transcriptional regulator n=1 Tax=Fulvimarina sp. MAC8 TaxID=3162874 RepID=UPI0032ECC0BA